MHGKISVPPDPSTPVYFAVWSARVFNHVRNNPDEFAPTAVSCGQHIGMWVGTSWIRHWRQVIFQPWTTPTQSWKCYGLNGKARITQPRLVRFDLPPKIAMNALSGTRCRQVYRAGILVGKAAITELYFWGFEVFRGWETTCWHTILDVTESIARRGES